MKKIVLTPVKNEDRILDLFLSCASIRADHIIIADQQSTDRTAEICKKYEKVIYIVNNTPGVNQGLARKLLLNEARKIAGEKLIFTLDADEILSSNVIDNQTFWKSLETLAIGHSVELPWINLRGSPYRYRNDSSMRSGIWKHFIFKDDGITGYEEIKTTSESRMPRKFMEQSIQINDIQNLHFQFVDLARMKSKQKRYRVYDFINATNADFWTAFKINIMYYPTTHIQNVITSITPNNRIAQYQQNIDIYLIQREIIQSYRFENDILEQFTEYSPKYFQYLDIRDTDRNQKAKALGIPGNFDDPRSFLIKLYHRSQIVLYYINKLIPLWIKKYL